MIDISTSQAAPSGSWLGGVSSNLDYYLTRYWTENCEPRFNKSALMSGGPWQMLTITMTYLVAVTLFGPYMMRKRKAMTNLLWPIRIYNGFMVMFNLYLYLGWSKKINWGLDCWGCGKSMQKFDQSGLVLWELTLLSRYFDFLDSVFFVCRKFSPTPMTMFAGYINLPIHVIMYTYYGLSTFPELRKFLWWKKYITTIQIIQFCIDLAHSLQVFYMPFCNYHFLTYVQTAFSLIFLYLFSQFYLKSYINNKRRNSCKQELKLHEEQTKKTA